MKTSTRFILPITIAGLMLNLNIASGQCILPSTPSPITDPGGNQRICPGDVRIYTTGADAGVTFDWAVPTGATINNGQGSNSINVTYDNTFIVDGIVSVMKVNNCGSSLPRQLIVHRKHMILSIPCPIHSSGRPDICPGESRVYTTEPDPAVTFVWKVPVGATIANGQGTNSVSVDFDNNYNGGNIGVKKVNYCGNSATRIAIITKRITPTAPSKMTGARSILCAAQNEIYSVDDDPSLTYNWSVPPGASIANGQGTHSIMVNFPAVANFTGVVAVNTTNGCGITSADRSLTVKAVLAAPDSIYGDVNVCSNSSGNAYSINPVVSATDYTWTGPGGSHITANGVTSPGNVLTTTETAVTIQLGTVSATSRIRVMANNTCVSSGLKSLLLVTCAPRLEGITTKLNGTIYPNPSNGLFTLVLNASENSGYTTIRVQDLLGKEVMSENVTTTSGSTEHQMDLQKLNPGLYFLTVLSQKEKTVIKFTIQ